MSGENINRRLNIYINDREIVNSSRAVDREMAKIRNQIKGLNKGAEDYDKTLTHLKDTYTKLQATQAGFRRELSGTPSILDRIKKSLGPVGTGMIAAFSVGALISGFTSKVREAWQMVVEFDQKQADLASIMGKSRPQIAGLTLDAIKYGSSTAYNATEVSNLQTELARLGKTAPEIKAMTKDVLNAATALETDLGSAATLVGGQLNSYGENANQAAKYSDIMANSVNISATSYEYLLGSLPKVSAVAAQNNVTFERLNATMGVLADQNIQAETAGTGFRNILLEAAKAGKPYQQMLDEVKNSADQSKKAVELFGKENATVAVILANSTEKINSNTAALENSAGSAEKLAKEKLNSIKGSIEGFSGAWEGFLLSLEKGDGWIAKTVRGFIDMGTGVLNLLTPMKRLSDQLKEEQLDLNMLVSRITSTNISNAERKQLLIELNQNYPEFTKNINIETVSNEQLNTQLNKVNENYIKRIALQKQVENVEDAQNEAGKWLASRLKAQEELFKKLNDVKGKFALKVPIDYSNLAKSAKQIKDEMNKKGVGESMFFSESRAINNLVSAMNLWDDKLKTSNKEVQAQVNILNRQQSALGINTEAQNEANVAAEAQLEILKKLRIEAKSLGMKNADTSTEQELKLWIAAFKEKAKYTGEMSEEEKKKRERELEEARRHSNQLLEEFKASQKELLDTKRAFQDVDLANQKESYEKERQLINQEFDRKIEDLKLKAKQEQEEINKLQSDLKDPKNNKSDVAILQKTIDNKKLILSEFNKTVIALESTRDIKLAQLQEKYLNNEIKAAEEANKKQLSLLKERQKIEIDGINTLEEAKAVLSNYLSEEELKNVKTLQDAKQKIKEQHLKDEYALQEKYLVDMIAQMQSLLLTEDITGIPLISEEERATLLAFLDEAALKLAALRNGGKNLETPDESKDIKALSGIDILGFSPEQWQNTFDSIDTFSEKIAAIEMTIGAVKNAFGMYFQFLEAGERRQLQNFESSNRKKQKELSDQLERGYITQEIYNARKERLDAELDQKKARLEYKQAKREKLMNVASIIANTAVGVSKAIAQGGFIFGVPWAAIVAGLGAVQLVSALAQPLPSPDGFYDGGYTGDGPEKGSPGPVHFKEYVVPAKVLFSDDPEIPRMIDYIEAKRTGRAPSNNYQSESMPSSSSSSGNSNNSEILFVMSRTLDVLEKIEEKDFIAYLTDDIPTAKKMRERIKKLEEIEKKAKKNK